MNHTISQHKALREFVESRRSLWPFRLMVIAVVAFWASVAYVIGG